MTDNKPKIEAIHPLNSVQQGLLFHHLMDGEDQGFLTVQYVIEGDLDRNKLQEAWRYAVARHEVMRTSVHWKKIEKPVLVVRPEKDIVWSFLDWQDKSSIQQEEAFESYKKERKAVGVALDQDPLSKMSLIQKSRDSYFLLWECHHLLLDGWSSTIILRDAFAYYQGLVTNHKIDLPSVPSYASYTTWLQNNSDETASQFWANAFSDFKSAPLLQDTISQSPKAKSGSYTHTFPLEISKEIRQLARDYKVTLNTLFQGVWSLALASFFKANDITFGNTVSGRSIGFPDIDRMAGMFTNVLPVRATFEQSSAVEVVLRSIQKQQQEARTYEYCKLDEIRAWATIPDDQPLFDSLFVFENFPWEDITSGGVTVKGFKGGVTTTYPLTAIFKIEEHIICELLIDQTLISEEVIQWFLKVIPQICTILLKDKSQSIESIRHQLPKVISSLSRKREQHSLTKEELSYTAPSNQVELDLVEIWEQLLGIKYVSTTESFFHLGGKSLLSLKMFTLIEQKIGVKLPPTALLESPTIQRLALVIAGADEKGATWKSLVPIKTKGKKAPLFCIHAGGGHVFFYKALADAIDVDRPVYALQPLGIFGEENRHQSIEEMARNYADEIAQVQPKGVINIVVYCFSTAVGLEMATYLRSKNRETHLIVADTIAEHRLLLDKKRLSIRVSAFLKRLAGNPYRALYDMIGFRVMFYLKPITVKLFGNEAEKNTENMRLHLVDLFNHYTWQARATALSLVLTKKGDPRYNEEIERSWKPLVQGSMQVHVCKADHKTFFENPDVIETAKAIDRIIVEKQ